MFIHFNSIDSGCDRVTIWLIALFQTEQKSATTFIPIAMKTKWFRLIFKVLDVLYSLSRLPPKLLSAIFLLQGMKMKQYLLVLSLNHATSIYVLSAETFTYSPLFMIFLYRIQNYNISYIW